MKKYRLYHCRKHVWGEINANSALEACQKLNWLIDDCWVREKTQGKYANGWKDITPRLKK